MNNYQIINKCCQNNNRCCNCCLTRPSMIGPTSPQGIQGPTGPTGGTGAPGPTGPAGIGVLNHADFYALMPPDNAATVATGTEQIIETAIVQTSVINSVLTVRNPADNPAALTITPLAGGTEPVSAHLVILQIA